MIVRRSNKNAFSMHSNDRTWIIILKIIFFRDWLFQSLIIFQNKQIQKNWIDEWFQSVYAVSLNEWIDNEIEFAWLKKIFHFQIIDLKNQRFFLIDDHELHVFVQFIEYCCAINIIFLCFSFHTIHYFQSLNVDCFESLVKAYCWYHTVFSLARPRDLVTKRAISRTQSRISHK